MSNDLKCVTPRGRESWQGSVSRSECWLRVCFHNLNFQVVKIEHALCLWDEHFSVTILYSVIAFAALLMWGSRENKWVWPLGYWMMPLIFIRGRVGGQQIWGRREGQIRNSVGATLSLRLCVKGPQDHPQVQWFAGRIHGTQKNYCVTVMVYYSKKRQFKIIKGKKCIGQSLGETRHELPVVLSQWSYVDRNNTWQHPRSVTNQESSPEL